MNRWLYIWIVFFFSFSARAQMCGPQANQFAFEPLKEFVTHDCLETKASKECQDLYAQMRQNNVNPDEMGLVCSEKNILLQMLETNLDYRVGCAIGGWNFISDKAESLYKGAANIKATIEKNKAENAECSKDLNKKRAIYSDYNNSVPAMLKIEVPDDATLNRVDCAQLRAGARMMQTRQGMFAMDKVRSRLSDQNAKYNETEQEYVNWINSLKGKGGKFPDILGLAKDKLNELGIKLECYNDRQKAALVCEITSEIALMALGGPAVNALRAARIGNLAKMAGVKTAELLDKYKTVKKATAVMGRKLTRDEKKVIWEAHKIGGNRGYRVNGGAPGEYTMTDIRQKSKKLSEVDTISQEKRRELFEKKVVGQPVRDTAEFQAEQAAQNPQLWNIQPHMQKLSEGLNVGNKTATDAAFSEGEKYFTNRMNASPADFKKTFPENDLGGVLQGNYSGLNTNEASKLVNKYIETHGYEPLDAKQVIIERIQNESKELATRKTTAERVGSRDYQIYRNKELEYRLNYEILEAKYADKYNELDYDKVPSGDLEHLDSLRDEVKKLRESAKRNKWPTANEFDTSY